MTAAVLSIGTELTRGELINSNAAWLGERLTDLGFDVIEHATVPDDLEEIVAQLQRLAGRAQVVMCTGGLGPTSDDMTAQAVAQALGAPLLLHEPSLQRIRDLYARFSREMPKTNEKQAMMPTGAAVLPNPMGTAPGFAVELSGALMCFMPGVPREMFGMFEAEVLPRVGPLARRTTCQRHLRTFGQTESKLAEMLDDIEAQFAGVTIGYRASFPEIEIKVFARAADEASAQALADRAAAVVSERIGPYVFGHRETSFAGAVGRTLKSAGLTLAVAESCTGGLVGQMLTSVPGSSEYLLMDVVVYSNAAKTRLLGVSEDLLRHHGAVSEEAALALAKGALRVSEADVAVAVTGIAGPGGGTDDKPVGTVWIAAATRDGRVVAQHHELARFGDRERIRVLSAYLALGLVDRLAKGLST